MRTIRIASALCFVVCMVVTAARSQSVQSDLDKSFDFSKGKTFNFAVQHRKANDPLAQDSLNDGRIRTALESKLTASGFSRQTTARPDFDIAYYVTTKNQFNFQDYGFGPRWAGRRDIRVDRYTEGALIVDLIDTHTNQVVWRGRASGTVELKGIDKKIDKAVDKLVKKFVKDTKEKAKTS